MVKTTGIWWQLFAKILPAAVDASLGRGRQALAKDAADIAAVRIAMRLAKVPRVDRIWANFWVEDVPEV